ncbi:MAG: hypothetical protein HJJLKODD_00642 [Phycisphaerae bacterium]|nr:hypothetical protein [Phycisphaerae bacterium]
MALVRKYVCTLLLMMWLTPPLVSSAFGQESTVDERELPAQETPLTPDQEAYLRALPPVFDMASTVTAERSELAVPQQADIVFVIDGSGSIDGYDFDKQKQAIQEALTGPNSIIPANGSAAVAVVQFSSFARSEVTLTVINSPATAISVANAVANIVQMEGLTNLSTGLIEAQDIFSASNPLADRFVVVTTDGGLSDPYPAIQRAVQLRTMSNPAKISTGMINYNCGYLQQYTAWRRVIDELMQIANAPGSSTFTSLQPVGVYRCFSELPEYRAFFLEALCEFLNPTECFLDCNMNGIDDRTEADCDSDWLPDSCEYDCDTDGVPNDCDQYPGQSVVHVNVNVVGGNGDGSSWANAYTHLEEAINERRWDPTPCDQEYWVARGTYRSVGGGGGEVYRDAAFPTVRSRLFGGFTGNETARNQRNSNPATNNTILSAVHATPGEDNHYHIFGTDGLWFFELDGFTLEQAQSTAIGIAAQFSSASNEVTIRRCIIRNNGGPAIEITRGRVVIRDTVVENNATDFGYASALYLTGGGGPHLIAKSSFINNTGGYFGPVIVEPDLPVTIQNCLFRDNSQMGTYGAALTVLSRYYADPELPSAYIYNTAIFDNQGTAVNDLTYGGIEAANVTVARNTSGYLGGGWYKSAGQPSRLRNCIFWQNSDINGQTETSQIYEDDSFGSAEVEVNESLIQGCGSEYCGGGLLNFSADPLFVDSNNNNFRLRKTSPAIDRGNNAEVGYDSFDLDGDRRLNEVLPDLDGRSRIVNGDTIPGARVDLGAYEYSKLIWVETIPVHEIIAHTDIYPIFDPHPWP